MFFSIFLAIAVFAQCTPTESIWDPRVAAAKGKVCHLNLAIVAEIMCCKLMTLHLTSLSFIDADF